MAFLVGRLLSSQSERFKKLLKSFDLQKNWPSKKHFTFEHVDMLFIKLFHSSPKFKKQAKLQIISYHFQMLNIDRHPDC